MMLLMLLIHHPISSNIIQLISPILYKTNSFRHLCVFKCIFRYYPQHGGIVIHWSYREVLGHLSVHLQITFRELHIALGPFAWLLSSVMWCDPAILCTKDGRALARGPHMFAFSEVQYIVGGGVFLHWGRFHDFPGATSWLKPWRRPIKPRKFHVYFQIFRWVHS